MAAMAAAGCPLRKQNRQKFSYRPVAGASKARRGSAVMLVSGMAAVSRAVAREGPSSGPSVRPEDAGPDLWMADSGHAVTETARMPPGRYGAHRVG